MNDQLSTGGGAPAGGGDRRIYNVGAHGGIAAGSSIN